MTTHRRISWHQYSSLVLVLIAGGLVAATPAEAQTVADSSAFGESVDLSVAPILGTVLHVTSGAYPQVSGSAAPAYSQSNSAVSAVVSGSLLGDILRTGILNVHASSQMPGAAQTHGDAETVNLAVTIGHLLPLLSLNAQAIRSSATVDGTCGSSLVATGTADLVGASAGGSVGFGLSIPAHPSPNTVLINLLGIKIVLNEQFQTGNGTTSRSITVNALHIYLQNSLLSGLGVLDGDIVISQSHAAVQCPAVLPPASADLMITGSDSPDPAPAGGALHYNLTVTNQGPNPATGVVLTDALPAGLTGMSTNLGQGSCTPGPPVSCNLGTLAAGQSVPVTISATLPASSGTLVNTASLTSSVADPNPGNNSITFTTQVTGGGPGDPGPTPEKADLSLGVVADPASLQMGGTLRFIFTVINNGPNAAPSVVLSAPAPERAEVNSLTTTVGSCTTGAQLVCNLGSLAAGAQGKVTLSLTPLSLGAMLCGATVTSSVADPNPANNTASASASVNTPPVTSPPVDPGTCRIDVVPAATLLVPYFEVDLDHPGGPTTLFSVNNAQTTPRFAQVTLWTDWGIPSLSFTVALGGLDVQTFNIRDILGNGVLPSANGGPGCPSPAVAGVLPAALLSHLQAWHTGQKSPTQSNCAAPPREGRMATGYVTVDVVNNCTAANPTSPGYFAPGGQGIASDQNALWGDFFLVDNDQFQAHGDPVVHILAKPGAFTNHYTFYASFVNGSGADDRQPLGTSYATRYLSGGVFDGGTQLLIWRDAKVAHPTAVTCGQEPARMNLGGALYDEDQDALSIVPSTQMAPWSTQKMVLGGNGHFPLAFNFGWVQLDLWHSGSPLFGDVAQGWVTTIMSAKQRYSIGLRAVRLDSACDF